MANRVREQRTRKGMTQQELSVATGLHISLISRIENGKGCEVRTAQKIADALDATVDALFPRAA